MIISDSSINSMQYNINNGTASKTQSARSEAESSSASASGMRLSDAVLSGVDETISKALEQAGLPASAKNIMIAGKLLENQMSVSTDNLHNLIRQSNIFREASVSTLVLMNKNNIPVTHFTAAQLQGYIDNSQSLLSQIGDVADAFAEYLPNASDSETVAQLIDILTEPQAGSISEAGSESVSTAEAARQTENSISPQAANPQTGTTVRNIMSPDFDTAGTAELTNAEGESLSSGVTSGPASGSQDSVNDKSLPGTIADNASEAVPEKTSSFSTPPSSSDAQALADTMKQITGRDYDFSGKRASEILNEIKPELTQGDSDVLRELQGSPVFREMIKKAFGEKFTMEPGDIKDADSVNEYYKETLSSLEKMKELADKNGLTELSSKLSKPSDNIKFMDTVNNVLPFIQLPMKLDSGSAHGELYVFRNGRSISSPDDVKSVLLHLDMEHLGPTDIHMKLDAGHLALKFFCNDNESCNLLSTRVAELSDALSHKGFDMISEFTLRTDTRASMEEVLSGEPAYEHTVTYGFDIRA